MKRIISLSLVFVLMVCLCACSGNFAKVNLNETMEIPENGMIEKSVFDKIKKENAIAVFEGVSNEIGYEWTVFGSDITDTKDINLAVTLIKKGDAVKVTLGEKGSFGFSALLSVNLNDKWPSQSATAYSDGKAVYSVSVTGSKTSILNISVNKDITEFIIRPDKDSSSELTTVNSVTKDESDEKQTTQQNDSYLSDYDSNSYDMETEKVASENDETETTISSVAAQQSDGYLSSSDDSDNRVYSDGTDEEKDKYDTDPVPEGKPMPVEPEEQQINEAKAYSCTFSIECSTILNNLPDLDPDKRELVPSDGVILAPTTVAFYEGESVYDVLQRVCKDNGIHMESSWTPVYNSAYVEGINNLYEFDCGALSGWMYAVDGWYPNYGCSRYQLKDGEKVEWRYTCDLGRDVGCDWLAGS